MLCPKLESRSIPIADTIVRENSDTAKPPKTIDFSLQSSLMHAAPTSSVYDVLRGGSAGFTHADVSKHQLAKSIYRTTAIVAGINSFRSNPALKCL
jgi:hypothetical protein